MAMGASAQPQAAAGKVGLRSFYSLFGDGCNCTRGLLTSRPREHTSCFYSLFGDGATAHVLMHAVISDGQSFLFAVWRWVQLHVQKGSIRNVSRVSIRCLAMGATAPASSRSSVSRLPVSIRCLAMGASARKEPVKCWPQKFLFAVWRWGHLHISSWRRSYPTLFLFAVWRWGHLHRVDRVTRGTRRFLFAVWRWGHLHVQWKGASHVHKFLFAVWRWGHLHPSPVEGRLTSLDAMGLHTCLGGDSPRGHRGRSFCAFRLVRAGTHMSTLKRARPPVISLISRSRVLVRCGGLVCPATIAARPRGHTDARIMARAAGASCGR